MIRPRFDSWTAFDAAARPGLCAQAMARAHALEPSLHAYVSLSDRVGGPKTGALDGMPYAVIIDDQMLAAAVALRPTLAAAFIEQILGTADAAVLPVMAIRTPLVSECDPQESCFNPRTLYELSHMQSKGRLMTGGATE
jgi:hypothetical protein